MKYFKYIRFNYFNYCDNFEIIVGKVFFQGMSDRTRDLPLWEIQWK